MLSIGEIARRAGLRTSALRYYERVGLLPPPQRQSGRRQYDDQVLERLTVIRFARESGFSLREILELFGGRPYSKTMRQLAARKVNELSALIERARAMQALLETALRCNCLTLEECGKRLQKVSAARTR